MRNNIDRISYNLTANFLNFKIPALVSASAPGNGTTDKPPSQRRIRIIERTSKRQITGKSTKRTLQIEIEFKIQINAAPVDPSAPFSCNNRFPGYYADIGSGCQVIMAIITDFP